MPLAFIDWMLVVLYFVLSIGVGIVYSKRAGKDINEFFIAGRSLPWWLAGTGLVACTFAADTPLAVTGLVVANGIAGNWFWWSLLLSGMFTVFFFARLWHRARVITDVEFTEVRYSGGSAAFLRGFRAFYLAVPFNCLVMGWVILAMAKIVGVTLDWPKELSVTISVLIALIYAVLAGSWGVVVTGFIQFIIAMTGSIVLAIYGLRAVGGMEALKLKLAALPGSGGDLLNFMPRLDSPWLPITTFLVYLGVMWWASWYPGAEPGGGGYVVKNLLSTKDEKNSFLTAFWFNLAHYAIRPWPWIITGLVVAVVYPNIADPESGYPKLMMDYLPVGFKGLMVASFFAAFMSTISNQVNWGTSYVINDLYKRFIRKEADPRHYVLVARLATLAITVLALLVAFGLQTVVGAWQLLLQVAAGIGPVYILRWYWWRINAWSEISAMVAAFVISMALRALTDFGFSPTLVLTTAGTTIVWLLVTYLTPPVEEEKLASFCRLVRPGGPGWKPLRSKLPDVRFDRLDWTDLIDWLAGCLMIYAVIFALGKLLLGIWLQGAVFALVAVVAAFYLYRSLLRKGWAGLM